MNFKVEDFHSAYQQANLFIESNVFTRKKHSNINHTSLEANEYKCDQKCIAKITWHCFQRIKLIQEIYSRLQVRMISRDLKL